MQKRDISTEIVRPQASHERIIALDALRVIAAFIVLAQHFRLVFELNWPEWLRKGLFDSKGAVMLFFVLSGYVLALSLGSRLPSFMAYVKFVVRRLFRLFPVYWAALLLAFAVLWCVQKHGAGQVTGLPAWFLDSRDMQWKQWLLQSTLVAPGMKSDFSLPTVWTLMTEAKVSMVFPLLAWVILRSPGWLAGALVAALVLGSAWLDQHVVGTAAFLGMFALGTLLCRLPSTAWSRLNQAAWWGLMLLGLGLYAAISWRYVMPSIWLGYYLCGLGSLIFIAGTIHWPRMRSLLTRLQQLLRVDLSYSIYILHYPVLVALKKLCGSAIPASPLLAFMLALGLTVGLGLLLHFTIEMPAIELGRRLTRSRTAQQSVLPHE
ncbi:acyltransferase family protein [Prosthecobacter vanneervenii]|uniref:Peptidoglycan/LPS O-acetylase OafA/YrhL n=1 Tax=Prosthecobacter vanneervenii TaxID=48466 RepID=A0A7W7Y6F0_9BACT|nr:acyltransferase [Prosthecobacter vanneervenii]MBB5030488.1 peptidoglycan/LPS O-acetylase OafA/YrhL [Prosthecobacter vanneervenii]